MAELWPMMEFNPINPISHDVFDQHKAMGGGSRNPPLLIPVKQKIEISASVQWHIYS